MTARQEYQELRRLAENSLEDGAWHNAPFLAAFIDEDDGPVFNGDDIAFMVATSPATVLRLLDALDTAEERLGRVEGIWTDYALGRGINPAPFLAELAARLADAKPPIAPLEDRSPVLGEGQ